MMERWSLLMITRQWVDPTTGEIVVGKLITEKQAESFKERELRKVNPYTNSQYVQVFVEGVEDLLNADEKDYTLYGASLVIATYLTFTSGQKLPQKSRTEIAKVLGVPKSSTVIKRLFERNIITKADSSYYLDECIAIKGKSKPNMAFVKTFQKNVQHLVKQKSVKLADIGLIFALIPHLSILGCYIVKDPNVFELENLEPFTMEELAQVLGIGRMTLYRKLTKMSAEFKELPGVELGLIAYIRTGGTDMIKLNPLLVARNVEQATAEGLNIFRVGASRRSRSKKS